MLATVIQWRTYSNCMDENTLIELAYPLRNKEEAIKMFLQEYPEADEKELSFYKYDTEANNDIHKAFSNSGCVRFYKTY